MYNMISLSLSIYVYIYIYILPREAVCKVAPALAAGCAPALAQQPTTYPHPRIPAARLFLFFVILRFSVFSST